MQIELETAEDLRSELDTNGTAEEIKDHPGVLLFEDDDETEEDVEAYVLTEEDKERFLDELCDLLKQAEEEHSVRVRCEMDLQHIADDELEMRRHYEV